MNRLKALAENVGIVLASACMVFCIAFVLTICWVSFSTTLIVAGSIAAYDMVASIVVLVYTED